VSGETLVAGADFRPEEGARDAVGVWYETCSRWMTGRSEVSARAMNMGRSMSIEFFWTLPASGDGRAIDNAQWNRGDYTPGRLVASGWRI